MVKISEDQICLFFSIDVLRFRLADLVRFFLPPSCTFAPLIFLLPAPFFINTSSSTSTSFINHVRPFDGFLSYRSSSDLA